MASHEQQPIRRLACARGLIGRASCYGLGNLMGPAERSGIADMAQPKVERRLAAILAMDVVGYARLMEAHEADTLTDLRAHRTELIEPSTAEHGGRIVKLMGDGILVEFPSAVEAVQCAVDVQRGMARRNAEVAAERRIEFRIGINLGDVVVDGDDIYGDGVNVAARLEGLAEPGAICIARNVFNQVRNKVELGFRHLGEQRVKNISEPVTVYGVLLDSARAGQVLGPE
jgi:adenylate cyclase